MPVGNFALFGLSRTVFSMMIVLVLGGLASGMWITGGGALLNDRLYDWTVRLVASEPPDGQGQVVILELLSESADQANIDWSHLLDELNRLGAKHISFLFQPDAEKGFYEAARKNGNVTFGRNAWLADEMTRSWRLDPIRPEAQGITSRIAAVAVIPARDGIYRAHSTHLGEERRPTLEAAIATALLGGEAGLHAGDYLVNFKTPLAALPKVDFNRLMNGKLTANFITGKTVLVGHVAKPHAIARHTPLKAKRQGLSDLEYHGFALMTLLSQSPVMPLGPIVGSGVIVIFCFLTALLFRLLPLGFRVGLTLVLAMLVLATHYSAYRFADTVIPTAELLLALLLSYVLFRHYSEVLKERVLGHMARGLSAHVHESLFSKVPSTSTEQWSQIGTVVSQTLDLKRSIFLEVVPGQSRVKEVVAHGCSLEDINEMRRDLSREPYTTALEAKSLIQPFWAFFKGTESDEQQYLVPLLFGGDLQGFWGLTMEGELEVEKEKALGERRRIVGVFADRIAERLYHDKQRRNDAVSNERERVLDGDEIGTEVRSVVHLLERREQLLENVLSSVSTAALVYDLFGHVLLLNSHLEELLKKIGVSPFNQNALDFIMAITSVSMAEGRQFLRHVLLDEGTITAPTSVEVEGKQFMLSIRAITQLDSTLEGVVSRGALEGTGILCELINITDLDARFRIKSALADFLNINLRNDFGALMLAARLLSDSRLPSGKRQQAKTMMDSVLDRAQETLGRIQDYLDQPSDGVTAEVFPIDPGLVLKQVVSGFEKQALENRITIEKDIPRFVSLVVAGPNALAAGLGAMLQVMFEDTDKGGVVSINLTESEKEVSVRFVNKGYGIPDDRFQGYLYGETPPSSPEFRNIRTFLELVDKWGAVSQCRSELGVGFSFQVKLRKVI